MELTFDELPEEETPRDYRALVAYALLVVFWLSATIAGFSYAVWSGFAAMSGASLVAAYFLGSDE